MVRRYMDKDLLPVSDIGGLPDGVALFAPIVALFEDGLGHRLPSGRPSGFTGLYLRRNCIAIAPFPEIHVGPAAKNLRWALSASISWCRSMSIQCARWPEGADSPVVKDCRREKVEAAG